MRMIARITGWTVVCAGLIPLLSSGPIVVPMIAALFGVFVGAFVGAILSGPFHSDHDIIGWPPVFWGTTAGCSLLFLIIAALIPKADAH